MTTATASSSMQHLLFGFRFNLGHAETLVKDLTDEQMVQQPHGVVNHPAWTLGHLASAANMVAKQFGKESTFPTDWEDKFKTGGVPSNDASTFPSKDRLLAELTTQHERAADAVANTDAAVFAQEFPDENTRKYFPTLGDFAAYLMGGHEGNHLGQIAAWRRAMGLPAAT